MRNMLGATTTADRELFLRPSRAGCKESSRLLFPFLNLHVPLPRLTTCTIPFYHGCSFHLNNSQLRWRLSLMRNMQNDLLRLPPDSSLIHAGVMFACRSLARTKSLPDSSNLRQLVAHTAAELALRRWFDKQRVAYQLQALQPFTQPERRSIILGGRRLHLHTQLISDPYTRRKILRNPGDISDIEIPTILTPPSRSLFEEGDLHLFGLVIAAETRSPSALEATQERDHPMALVALPPDPSWVQPARWRPFKKLTLENHCRHHVQLLLFGHNVSRQATQHPIQLSADAALSLDLPLHTLLCLHTQILPSACLVVRCDRVNLPWQVKPHAWQNLWLYGQAILFPGWITQKQIRERCSTARASHTSMRIKPIRIRAGTLEPIPRLLKLLENR